MKNFEKIMGGTGKKPINVFIHFFTNTVNKGYVFEYPTIFPHSIDLEGGGNVGSIP